MQKEILNTMHEKFITDVELGRGKSFSRVMMPMLFLSIQAVYGQHLRQLSTAGGWRSYVSRDPYTSFKMYSTDTFKTTMSLIVISVLHSAC